MAIVTGQAKLYQAFLSTVVDKNVSASLTNSVNLVCGIGQNQGAKARIKAVSSINCTGVLTIQGAVAKNDNTLQAVSGLNCKFPTYLRIDINKLDLPEATTVNLVIEDDFLREDTRKHPSSLGNPIVRQQVFTFRTPTNFKFAGNMVFGMNTINYRPRPFSATLTNALNFSMTGNYSPANGVTLVVNPFTQTTSAIKTARLVAQNLQSIASIYSNGGFLLEGQATSDLNMFINALNVRVRYSAVDPINSSFTQSANVIRNIGPITSTMSSTVSTTCTATVIRDFAVPIAPAATTILSAQVQNAMVFVYSTVSGTIRLPFDSRRQFAVYVDWGDGQITYHENEAGLVSHTYAVPRAETIIGVWGAAEKIGWEAVNVGGVVGSWNCPGISFLREYRSWGTLGLENLEYSCAYLNNLQSVPTKLPSTIEANGIRYMFFNNQNFNSSNVSQWGSSVSRITKLEGVFYNARAFNQNINGWDVSNVDSFANLFYDARAFNQPLSSWNTGNVRFMNYCFYNARAFNQPLSSWNTSKVINFNFMFANAVSFNQYIGDWDVTGEPITGAPNVNMEYMFSGADVFNQPLTNWDVSNVWNMRGLFNSADAYNQPMPNWDLSLVLSGSATFMFNGATSFNQDLSSWCVPQISSKPTNFDTGATAWTLPRPSWGTCP